jgi:cobaltochelatase CobS
MEHLEYDLGTTFNVPELNGSLIEGYKNVTPFVPNDEPDYQFSLELLCDLMVWYQGLSNDGLYLFGPTGCGKSSALTVFCARLNIPLYEKTMYDGLEFEGLLGRTSIIEGDTLFNYGPLPMAMGVTDQPGVFLINEIDQANEGVVTGMYEVLEGRPLTLEADGIDVIKPVLGFRIAATGNTNMLGDQSFHYNGAIKQNLAFLDRFMKVNIEYPTAEVENGLLSKLAPELSEELRTRMRNVAASIRLLFLSDEESAIDITMSTRSLLRWAKLCVQYKFVAQLGKTPHLYALDRAVLFGTSAPVKQAITDIVKLEIGEVE